MAEPEVPLPMSNVCSSGVRGNGEVVGGRGGAEVGRSEVASQDLLAAGSGAETGRGRLVEAPWLICERVKGKDGVLWESKSWPKDRPPEPSMDSEHRKLSIPTLEPDGMLEYRSKLTESHTDDGRGT